MIPLKQIINSGFAAVLRDYGINAIRDLGIKEISCRRMIHERLQLKGYGLELVEKVSDSNANRKGR